MSLVSQVFYLIFNLKVLDNESSLCAVEVAVSSAAALYLVMLCQCTTPPGMHCLHLRPPTLRQAPSSHGPHLAVLAALGTVSSYPFVSLHQVQSLPFSTSHSVNRLSGILLLSARMLAHTNCLETKTSLSFLFLQGHGCSIL